MSKDEVCEGCLCKRCCPYCDVLVCPEYKDAED